MFQQFAVTFDYKISDLDSYWNHLRFDSVHPSSQTLLDYFILPKMRGINCSRLFDFCPKSEILVGSDLHEAVLFV